MKEIWRQIKQNIDKRIALLWLAGFAACMLPVLYLSRYAVPACDDYYYGTATHQAWLQAHSLGAVLRAAVGTVAKYWINWQGTYSSIFMMSLTPGIWGERWYFVTTFLMAGILCGGITALMYVVLKKYVCAEGPDGERGGSGRWRILLCITVILFLSIQTLVAPSDALYWYNGALHYVFMESVFFFQAAVLLLFCRRRTADGTAAAEKKGRPLCDACLLILSVLLAAVLGGANLLTGLQSCILTAFLILYLFWLGYREKGEKKAAYRRTGCLVLLPMAVNLAGFAVNIFAPGNMIRETTGEGMGALQAILRSFYWAAVYFTEWMTPLVLAGFLLLIPVLWRMTENAGVRFFHPAAAAFLSYCVYAAMYTPTLFAMADEGPERCKNIMRIVLYLFVFFNLLNACGWLRRCRKENLAVRLLKDVEKNYAAWLLGCSICVVLIFLLPADKNTYTSISAFRSLVIGEAEQFYEENMDRIALYNDETLTDVTVPYLTARPYLLFKGDVGPEYSRTYWINVAIMEYYQKVHVYVEGEEPE